MSIMGLNNIKYSKAEIWWIREVWNTRVHIRIYVPYCTYLLTIYTNLHNVHRWISFLSAQSCYHKLPQLRGSEEHVYFHTVLDVRSLPSVSLCICVYTESCPTPWDSMGYSILCPGILQARIMECMPLPPPGDLPDPGIEPSPLLSPARAGRWILYHLCKLSQSQIVGRVVQSRIYEGRICFLVFFSRQQLPILLGVWSLPPASI